MTSPTLQNAVDWLRDGALDPLVSDSARAETEAFDKMALMFARVFGAPEGELVLKTLLDVSLFRTPVDHRLEGEAYLRFAQVRAGQNQLAATIVAYLEHAQTLKETPHVRHNGPGGPGLDLAGRPEPGAGEPGHTGGAGDVYRSGDWDTAVR